jgi:hypothetical protein
MSDPIREILRNTDSAMSAPIPRDGLASKVRRKLRNRRIAAGAATGIAIAAAVVLPLLLHQTRPLPAVQASEPTKYDRQLIEADATYHQMVADLLVKYEHGQNHRQTPKTDDFLWQLSQERDRTALLLIGSGDRIYRDFHNRPAAESHYRQVIHLFPESPAAALAQQKLQNLNEKGIQS